ncbi:hypothetical protein ElyMa_004767000 [Elysia marginata]|uniref:Ig-like domain-containing protein n=1 Tax=Elysia marginata TaxID=1093978 RepID=A0AAV4IJ76_9GAST|nr:hypothetical protein ElyMa_004767000 [Elysia marginata]
MLLLILVVFFSIVSTAYAGQKEIIRPSRLASDDVIVPIPGRFLTINCSADQVSLSRSLKDVIGIDFNRRLRGNKTRESIATVSMLGETNFEIPDGRDWTIDFLQATQSHVPIKNRNLHIRWRLFDARCNDAGLYECKVSFFHNDNTIALKGQQNISARALAKVSMKVSPEKRENQYYENDEVNISCIVFGPRNVTISWFSRPANLRLLQSVSTNITTEKPVRSNRDECGARGYETRSHLAFKMKKQDDGRMFECVVRHAYDPQQSAKLTLSISC